ncbi:MAG: MBL fold metallo-hydrolase [Bacteroidia bacterium]|jgi:glyoxylase-like metal-dependent hydrolase (beta-lactamase superfamily II)/rhodanese-related sulfurtransferase
MEIKQFEDKNLSHFSYAIVSKGEMAVIDPARDPQPYYDFAKQQQAKIIAVIETHPHADFVSSHLEIHTTTGATIYVSKLLGAEYPHQSFDDGDAIVLGAVTLKALNTPGHSPDSISIVAIDEKGNEKAVFTGDTLFIGDCGRPDLREKAGAITATKATLAKQMYHSLRDKLMILPNDVLVYPAHGAGSLCGKGLSEQSSSTIGAEKNGNWSLQDMSEEAFVKELLADQPFIPKYFPYDVAVNKKGASAYGGGISAVEKREPVSCKACINSLDKDIVVVDTRPQREFKKSHLKNSINLMNDTRFETWLGSIIKPGEKFYLAAENETELDKLVARIAKIGYENQIELAFVLKQGTLESPLFDSELLRSNENAYTIVDVRNELEVKAQKFFSNSIHIPLPELRERVTELPLDKPIVVHCAAGYRSAAGSSIISSVLGDKIPVYDLSENIKNFKNELHQQA